MFPVRGEMVLCRRCAMVSSSTLLWPPERHALGLPPMWMVWTRLLWCLWLCGHACKQDWLPAQFPTRSCFMLWLLLHWLVGLLLLFSQSVVTDSLWPHGLYPARHLCPWDSPGKNTGVGCQALLKRIFLIQGLNPHLWCLLHWRAGS